MRPMKVLIACEFSGIVRDAFIKRGHDAVSCDLLPTERPGPHLQCDVLTVLDQGWDLMIAHPDCTYLTNAANRWLYDARYPDRFEKRELAIQFFEKLINAPVPKKATENPIPHGALIARVGKYSQTIQPYQFGEDASKRTCLWLQGLPKLRPTGYFPPRQVEYKGKLVDRWGNQTVGGSNKYGPSADRWMKRARTFQGIADAMADQWGSL